jgi:23S rRNA (adenine2503-C2)-methyltransferase
MIEYLMIENLTDRDQDIKELLSFKLEKNTLFNLIPLNTEVILNNNKYTRSNPGRIVEFKQKLIDAGYKCFVREHKGEDISAACGMLK